MCDEGRYGYHHVHSDLTADRAASAARRAADAAGLVAAAVRENCTSELRQAGRVAAVLSPHLTVEEAYLLAKYIRGSRSQRGLSLGPVPVVGQDETFKNGFTIRAEKCPNRRGVEEVVKHFMRPRATFDDVLARSTQARSRALWVTGGYPRRLDRRRSWPTVGHGSRAGRAGPVRLAALARGDLSAARRGFAERDGLYVNHADRLQRVSWADSPAGRRAGRRQRVSGDCCNVRGLFNAREVLDEVAAEIPFFAVAADDVPGWASI